MCTRRLLTAAMMLAFVLTLSSCRSMKASRADVSEDDQHQVDVNLALHRPYVSSINASPNYPDSGGVELTDGIYAALASIDSQEWQGRNSSYEQTMDLGRSCAINSVSCNFLQDAQAGIHFPVKVTFKYSRDNVAFKTMGTGTGTAEDNVLTSSLTLDEPAIGRYVKVAVVVHMWAFVDEMEVWGTPHAGALPPFEPDANLGPAPRGGPYFELSEGTTILEGTEGGWDAEGVRTLSIVEANQGGFKYWGYYGGGEFHCSEGIGLARSNDLVTWTKHSTSAPILTTDAAGHGGSWPSVALVDGTFVMVLTKDFDADSCICLYESKDGASFAFRKKIVPARAGVRNQDPCLFRDPKDGAWYLYYYCGDDVSDFKIKARRASSIASLDTAKDTVVMTNVANELVAAPSVFAWQGRYYLLTGTTIESRDDWRTVAWVSEHPDKGFMQCRNSPLPRAIQACALQSYLDNNLRITYASQVAAPPAPRWSVRAASAANLPEK